MPCAIAASLKIHASVRPAIGMPWNAFAMAKTSSNANDIARPPAPPVSTRVPSMSNSTSVDAPVLAFAANVAGARPFSRRLFVEADALAFIQ